MQKAGKDGEGFLQQEMRRNWMTSSLTASIHQETKMYNWEHTWLIL